MNTAILDTNIILRYILKDNPELFGKAQPIMEALRQGACQALILEGVLVECVYVLSKVYKIPRNEIADALNGVLNYSGIANPDKPRLTQALGIFERDNVDIVDALIFATAAERGLEIFSFDKDIQRLKRIYDA